VTELVRRVSVVGAVVLEEPRKFGSHSEGIVSFPWASGNCA